MKIKNKSDYTITMHTAKVTKEVLEIEPTRYISNNVNDENYDEAFALVYNQSFKKCFESVSNIRIISKEDEINLDYIEGQIFVHQNFEYDVIENMGSPDAIASAVARLHAKYQQLAAQAASQEKP